MVRRRWFGASDAAAVMLIAVFASQARAGNERAESEHRVLFVGNSYTSFNDLPEMVEAISEAVPDGPRVRVAKVTRGRANLRFHWEKGRALRRIRSGSFTDVVLQGQSLTAFLTPNELREYAGRFEQAAADSGARTVLYATWARHPKHGIYRRGYAGRNPTEMQERIDGTYGRVASEIGAELAPVGRAWMEALAERPHLRLHLRDGSHPTRHGSYLAACVLYQAITGHSPVGATFRPQGMLPVEAQRIQALAIAAAEKTKQPTISTVLAENRSSTPAAQDAFRP